ncbi:hypothetical protein [Kitasatospora sp. HPMI-4]|uniref:hypothetical protein n=1 Tax=Kitasatospora sp. HPMI-4 TaxID=3448443 RepID=UPI003F1DF287
MTIGDSIAYGRSDPQVAGPWQLVAAHIAMNEAEHHVLNVAVPGCMLADVRRRRPGSSRPECPTR